MTADIRTDSSDLDRARAIARSLEAGAPAAPESAFPFALLSVVPKEQSRPALHGLDIPLPKDAPWTRVVDHCLAQTGAMGLVIVDDNGFIVASSGHWHDWSEGHLDAISARLMAALDQVERLEGPWGHCDRLSLALGEDHLTGVRVDTATGRLTLALLACQPLPDALCRALQKQIQASLG
jgi:hypothetical protein